jgi:hypothetical protein
LYSTIIPNPHSAVPTVALPSCGHVGHGLLGRLYGPHHSDAFTGRRLLYHFQLATADSSPFVVHAPTQSALTPVNVNLNVRSTMYYVVQITCYIPELELKTELRMAVASASSLLFESSAKAQPKHSLRPPVAPVSRHNKRLPHPRSFACYCDEL